jgi:hypothetical protein
VTRALPVAALSLAILAVAGAAYVVLRPPPAVAPSRGGAPPSPPPSPASPAPEPPGTIRPYRTTSTLAEDLRDALASGAPPIAEEWRRVSDALRPQARYVLETLAPAEASPRVRALLVLAAGVHLPDSAALAKFLEDRSAVVRRAAALAAVFDARGARSVPLLEGLAVPIGRNPGSETAAAVRARLAKEEDEGVRGTLEAALSLRR